MLQSGKQTLLIIRKKVLSSVDHVGKCFTMTAMTTALSAASNPSSTMSTTSTHAYSNNIASKLIPPNFSQIKKTLT